VVPTGNTKRSFFLTDDYKKQFFRLIAIIVGWTNCNWWYQLETLKGLFFLTDDYKKQFFRLIAIIVGWTNCNWWYQLETLKGLFSY